MPGKISLFVPGPTNMPDSVRQSMDISNEDHRAPGMDKFWHPLIDDLKKFLKQHLLSLLFFQEQVVADGKRRLTNLLNKGDKVLSARFGQFSHLWIEMCKKLHIDVEVVDTVEWGSGTPHDEFEKILSEDKNHEIKAVLVTHNETSTGVTNDVKGY
jgi:alanine-glyoxylate transaminase/serine-glyoxylate transaminase/serine-pyruvate transaminase